MYVRRTSEKINSRYTDKLIEFKESQLDIIQYSECKMRTLGR